MWNGMKIKNKIYRMQLKQCLDGNLQCNACIEKKRERPQINDTCI